MRRSTYRKQVGEGFTPPDKICTDFNDGSSDFGLRPGLCPAHPPYGSTHVVGLKSGVLPRLPLEGAVAAGVIRRGDGIQVVYGPQVSVIKSELEEHIRSEERRVGKE